MNGCKVLIVEDDAALAAGLVRGLKAVGYGVDLETSGRDVVRRVLAGGYDVIVLDLNLPDLSGVSILGQLKERATTPIIVLTARTELAARLESFALGASDYLSKPFFIEELLARIQTRLGRAIEPPRSQRPLCKPVRRLRSAHGHGRGRAGAPDQDRVRSARVSV